jgi:hypothetical protein
MSITKLSKMYGVTVNLLKQLFKSNKCQCDGCKISRDPRSGYQPCHNVKFSGEPPKGD